MKTYGSLIQLSFVSAVLLGILLLVSCSMGGAESDAAEYFRQEKSAPSAVARGMALEEAPMESEAMMMDTVGESASDGSSVNTAPEDPQPERKRVYNGSAGLVVDDAEETRINLENMANDSGGYVESSYSDYVVLRVPAEAFSEIFERILNAGRVEYSRVETLDITDAYADLERVLVTARETRERLYVLLERSSDPAERARILREIGRLTEEISSLEQQMELMESRLAFSRITVQLIPRKPAEFSRSDIPFPWIAYLDPLSPAGSRLKANVDLEPGAEWAVFSKHDLYLAENAAKDQIVISTIENNPRGDAEFWGRALLHHLGPWYAEAEEKNLDFGDSLLKGVELVSKDREPFRYFVGVVADGKNLHVVEVFSPEGSGSFDEIYDVFEQGGIR